MNKVELIEDTLIGYNVQSSEATLREIAEVIAERLESLENAPTALSQEFVAYDKEGTPVRELIRALTDRPIDYLR